MTHGYPPWAGITKTTIFTLPLDLAEHAVRLGSIHRFDRRGDVVYLTTFNDGWGLMQRAANGTGASATISSAVARSGAYSAKLVGDSAQLVYTFLYCYLPFPYLSKFGAEVSFTIGDDVEEVKLALWLYNGANSFAADLLLDVADDTLRYRDEDNAWQDLITDLGLSSNDSLFHNLKLVTDLSEGEYERAIFDNNGEPMEGIPYYSAESAEAPHLYFSIGTKPTSGENGYIYVDDIIVTQNEP